MKGKWNVLLFVASVLRLASFVAQGEFCMGDRALLFEDLTGVRILAAPGRTVKGSADASLPNPADVSGGVHVLLIDHPHVDHVGDVFRTHCAGTTSTPFAFPSEGNAPEIASVHKSAALPAENSKTSLHRRLTTLAERRRRAVLRPGWTML